MIGRVFLDRYETVRLLGKGGMGSAFLARAQDSGGAVVVKVMHEHVAGKPQFRERFEREVALMAKLSHPNAVGFIDSSLEDPNGPCIVMEYAAGITLDQLLNRNQRFAPTRIYRLMSQLCDVLQAAHDAGLVHRDLKPGNLIIMEPDTPREVLKVMDFGLAQMAEPAKQQAAGSAKEYAVGTPGYMSPEQVHGEECDQRADLYSVGVILYQLLSGRLPFKGRSTMEILMAQATQPPPTFAMIGMADLVSASVEDVVRWTLESKPDDRPSSAEELFEAYEAALQGNFSQMPESPPPGEESTSIIPEGEGLADLPAQATTSTFELEAYMPEQIAIHKIEGFAEEFGGEVVDTAPGLVRIRMPFLRRILKQSGKSGIISWLGLKPKYGKLEVELHMTKRLDAANQNMLLISVAMHPAGSLTAPEHRDWQSSCEYIFSELKAYLMSK